MLIGEVGPPKYQDTSVDRIFCPHHCRVLHRISSSEAEFASHVHFLDNFPRNHTMSISSHIVGYVSLSLLPLLAELGREEVSRGHMIRRGVFTEMVSTDQKSLIMCRSDIYTYM